MNIKPGYGFWNITHHPYGGDFGRAPKDKSIPCEIVPDSFDKRKGYEVILLANCGHNKLGDRVVVTPDGLEGLGQ